MSSSVEISHPSGDLKKLNGLGRRYTVAIVVALLAVHAGLAYTSLVRKGLTYDEGEYISSGYVYWHEGDYRLNPEHPPLAKYWATLPLLRFEFPERNPDWEEHNDAWEMGRRFLFSTANDPQEILNRARLMMVIWSVGLGFAVFLWSMRLYGVFGGLFSLALYAFSPTILAHGRLVTLDLPVASGLLLGTWGLWYMLGRISPFSVLVCGLVVSLAILSKISGVLLVPVAVILLIARTASSRPLLIGFLRIREIRSRTLGLALGIAALTMNSLVVFACVWASYGFRYSANPSGATDLDALAERQAAEQSAREESEAGKVRKLAVRVIAVLRAGKLLPEAFIHCIDEQSSILGQRPAFMNGQRSMTGWWYFFPYCFVVKTPIGFLVVLAAGAIAWFVRLIRRKGRSVKDSSLASRRDRDFSRLEPLPLLVLLGVYLVFALTCRVNIGHRYLLPIYPPFFVLCGSLMRTGWRPVRVLSWACVLLAAVGATRVWPDYLAYFNSFVGGPAQGYRHLVDSSVDWGQDLPGLKRWLDEELEATGEGGAPIEPPRVYLSYFGADHPGRRGIEAQMVGALSASAWKPPREYAFRGGIYAISATNLQQVYSLTETQWVALSEAAYQVSRAAYTGEGDVVEGSESALLLNRILSRPTPLARSNVWFAYESLAFGRLCAVLRQREPDAQIGYSINIYRLSDAEVQQALEAPASELFGIRSQ